MLTARGVLMATYNRRKHRRISARGLTVQLRTGAGSVPCLVENLSTGGIFLRTSELSPVGALVEITLTRPGWKRPLGVTCRVASAVDQHDLVGMGVEFQAVAPEDASRMANLLVEMGAAKPKVPPPNPELAAATDRTLVRPAQGAVPRVPGPGPGLRPGVVPAAPPSPVVLEKRIHGLTEELARTKAALEEKDRQLTRFRTELDRVRLELKTKEGLLMQLGGKARR